MTKYINTILCGLLLSNVFPFAAMADGFEQEIVQTPSSLPVMTDGVTESLSTDTFVPPVNLIWDEHLSPYVGAELFMSATRSYELLDDYIVQSTEGNNATGAILGRSGKYILESVLASWASIAQHEYFGHGFRLREFHVPVAKFHILPFEGYTTFAADKYNQLSLNEKTTVTIAGMEAENILATRLRNRWLDTGYMDTREASLYFMNTISQTGYIFSSNKNHGAFSTGHDIQDYVLEINQWYGRSVVSVRKLKNKALVDFLDPFLYYSLYNNFMYIFDGAQGFQYPMIQLGEYQYLPGFRLNFTPFGTEYQFNNYIKTPCRIVQASFRLGETDHKQTWGLGLTASQLLNTDLLTIDGKFDLWRQPQLFKSSAALAKNQLGAAASFIARYKIAPQLDINAQIGYKTSGYLQGEPLRRGVIFKIGFGAYL